MAAGLTTGFQAPWTAVLTERRCERHRETGEEEEEQEMVNLNRILIKIIAQPFVYHIVY